MNIKKEYITYAAYSKSEEIRISSSSGGVFTHLAERVLSNNGVVFGAMFDENFNVVHNYIDSADELKKLRGSKYVKSKTGNSFKKAKEFLDMGKNVYFSGTPCQIAGLKAFLKKDYDNLITQDVICHVRLTLKFGANILIIFSRNAVFPPKMCFSGINRRDGRIIQSQ